MNNFYAALAEFAYRHGQVPLQPAAAPNNVAPGNPGPDQLDAHLAEFELGARSFLGDYLLEQWAMGFLSVRTVQELAMRAAQDGCHQDTLVKLSMIGCSGTNSNCTRDLLRHF